MCGSVTPLGLIREPVLAGLYDYWCGKRAGGDLPARASIAPEDIVPALRHVLLIDVLEGGQTLRYRLVGTAVAAESDPTGRTMQETLPAGEYRDHILGLFGAVVDRGEALYTRHRYPERDPRRRSEVERVFLPLAADGQTVDMILVGQIRHAPRPMGVGSTDSPAQLVEEFERTFLA